jgi:uncharacterized paraquat-inducible protein A
MPDPIRSEIRCLYCGQMYPDDAPSCPHCQAPTHTLRRATRLRQFRWFVALLAVLCAILILWLPR